MDRGVKKHLLPEMARTDWDVIIAHFLGVDHCGHRYGPNHPAMRDKLNEIDEVIRYGKTVRLGLNLLLLQF